MWTLSHDGLIEYLIADPAAPLLPGDERLPRFFDADCALDFLIGLRGRALLDEGLRDHAWERARSEGGRAPSDRAILGAVTRALAEGTWTLVARPVALAGGAREAPAAEVEVRAAPPSRPDEKVDWIEIALLDHEHVPIGGERYRVEAPDGSIREGKLDRDGLAFEDHLDRGACKVSFPALHHRTLRARRNAEEPIPRPAGAASIRPGDELSATTGLSYTFVVEAEIRCRWSAPLRYRLEEVDMWIEVSPPVTGTLHLAVRIHGGRGEPIHEIDAPIEGGEAKIPWAVLSDLNGDDVLYTVSGPGARARRSEPSRLIFDARLGRLSARSDVLTVVEGLHVRLVGDDGHPVSASVATVTLPDGGERKVDIGADGVARIEEIVGGTCIVDTGLTRRARVAVPTVDRRDASAHVVRVPTVLDVAAPIPAAAVGPALDPERLAYRRLFDARWSVRKARPGDAVELLVDTEGLPTGTPVGLEIWEHDQDGAHDLVARLEGAVAANEVRVPWTYTYVEDDDDAETEQDRRLGAPVPEFHFVAKAAGVEATSLLLEFRDDLTLRATLPDGRPAREWQYTVHLAEGDRTGTLDEAGEALEIDVPPGPVEVTFSRPACHTFGQLVEEEDTQ